MGWFDTAVEEVERQEGLVERVRAADAWHEEVKWKLFCGWVQTAKERGNRGKESKEEKKPRKNEKK